MVELKRLPELLRSKQLRKLGPGIYLSPAPTLYRNQAEASAATFLALWQSVKLGEEESEK